MELLGEIDRQLGWPKVDQRGERWPCCVFHADRRVGSFSYSERGFSCFSCGEKGSLYRLAEHLGILAGDAQQYRPTPRPRPTVPPPAPPRPWQQDPGILDRFQPLAQLGLDYAHSRGLTDATIARWRIGWGVLPSSRARLPRLILPVIESGQVVGLRGRAVHPDDDAPKWLVAAGSKTTLFGAESLRPGGAVIVTEAPLACCLVAQQHPDVAAVASTAGCGTWKDEWTEMIRAARPSGVLVWMDRDDAGDAAAVKVGNALAAAQVPVHVYRWSKGTPPKYDLADLTLASIQGRRVAA